jgi:Spy/CpxP family protein refolding chaperone
MKRLKIGIMVLMLAASALTAVAQQGPLPGGQYDETGLANPDQAKGGGVPSAERRAEVRKKIEAVRIWRLTEALKLDAATSAKLSSLLSSYDQQQQDIQREQMKTMSALHLALKAPNPDEAKLKTALVTIEKNHRAMQELRNKEMSDLKGILTIEQQARYLVFQQEFMREMRGMIGGARGNGPGKGGRGPGDGPGMGGGQMRGGPGHPPDN